ncbi:MAG: hypothetical protein WC152_07535 [Candidatus Izemoplasmatales bacterium]
MNDFNLIIKALFSAITLYVVVNSIFRFHVYSNIFFVLFVFSVLIVFIIYSDLVYNALFTILISASALINLVCYCYLKIKKTEYFVLFNIGRTGYHRIRYFLQLNNEKNINYSYNKKTFWLLKLFDNGKGEVKKIMKGIEAAESKRKKRFTINNYWIIIIFITMMVVLWRF